MTTELHFGRDVQGYNAYAPPDSGDKYSATLSAGAPTTITVPSNFPVWVVAFSPQPGANIWVDFTGETAAAPVGGTLAKTTSSLNPGQRTVLGGSTISVVTSNTSAEIGIELWSNSYA